MTARPSATNSSNTSRTSNANVSDSCSLRKNNIAIDKDAVMTNVHSTPEDPSDAEPHVGRQSASDERLKHIEANRSKWLGDLPAEFHEFVSYAVYDKTKRPSLVKILLGDKEAAGGKSFKELWMDWNNLATHQDAVKALQAWPSLYVGLSLYMKPSYQIACVDLDNVNKEYDKKVELARRVSSNGVASPADLAALAEARDRQNAVNELILKTFREAGALIMLSQSGKGFHIFFAYTPPSDKVFPNGRFKFCGQLISYGTAVHITGEQIPVEWGNERAGDDDDEGAPIMRTFTSADRLPDLGKLAFTMMDDLSRSGDFSQNMKGSDDDGRPLEVEVSEKHGRKLGLADVDVLAKLAGTRYLSKEHAALTTGVLPEGITSVSWALRDVISAIETVTGDPMQIQRIIMASPLVTRNPRSEGETREDKTLRLMPRWIAKARAKNDKFFSERQAKVLALAPIKAGIRDAVAIGQFMVGAEATQGSPAAGNGDIYAAAREAAEAEASKLPATMTAQGNSDRTGLAKRHFFTDCDAAVAWFDQHFYIVQNIGGSLAVVDRSDESMQTSTKFMESYGRHMVQYQGINKDGKDVTITEKLVTYWFKVTNENYTRRVFEPYSASLMTPPATINGVRNTFTGFAASRMKG